MTGVSAIQNAVMWAALMGIGACLMVLFLESTKELVKDAFRRNRIGLFMSILCVTVFTYYGGTKSIYNKTSADDNILLQEIDLSPIEEVVQISAEVFVTNIIGAKFTICVEPGSQAPQPIWFRNNNHETWTNVTDVAEWVPSEGPQYDPSLSGNGTNVYVWTTSNLDFTNHMNHAQYYIGTTLPPVEVDVTDDEYIFLDEISITSKRVHFKFHLNDVLTYPEGTKIAIQRNVENTTWEDVDTIDAVPAGQYNWNGFSVGKNSKWRLHLSIVKEN